MDETVETPGQYRPVPTIPDRVALEHRVLEQWNETNTFELLRAQTATGSPFSFLDGPITANNPMGVHHAWGRTLKDAIQRYHAMNGRALRWQNGFDCQGLWVEVEVEKALGFNSKHQIEEFGLDRFAVACRERVATYADRITEQSKRLGMWMDWSRSYFTMTDTNITYIWTFLAECNRRGWLYKGHRLMPWCHRCGTSLSQHELTDSYADLVHPSVYFAVPLVGTAGESLAVWTTTPWTLPANVAVAVHPEAIYSLLRTAHGDVWVAAERVEDVPLDGEVVGTCRGAELAGRHYLPPVPDLDAQQGVNFRIVTWTDVALDEGTGAVHIAPGCGAEDFDLASQLGLQVLNPVDESGAYGPAYGWLAGRHVSDVDSDILASLASNHRLLHAAELTHRYPLCWRCSTPLVHRVVDEWFISCDEIRQPMRDAAANVHWHPRHYGKRMDDWLSNMADWCISRKRYWGLPLPFYFCADAHMTVVSSKQDLQERALDQSLDIPELHRPWIDQVKIACAECGAEAQRVPEVGDCWLDAGIVPFSTLGWNNPTARPGGYADGAGEGLTAADLPDHGYWQAWFPAEVVCEMHEQIRLWFYSMLFMSVVLEGRPPYKAVLAYSRVNDEAGREMHKSWGNAIWFDDAVEEIGADTMRWLYASQSPARDLNFGYGAGREAARHFLTFWNAYVFFVTYASIDGYRATASAIEAGPDPSGLSALDQWMLARTRQLVASAARSYESLDLPAVTQAFEAFADDLSNWYVRLSRHRFWGGGPSTRDEAAYGTLWHALVTATRCLAPVMPFVTEAIWTNIVAGVVADSPASVHLSGYPTAVEAEDTEILEAMAVARRVAELGRSAREASDLRRRQPLARLVAVSVDPVSRRRLADLAELVARECNVKHVEVAEDAEAFCTIEVAPVFSTLGPKFRDEATRIADLLRNGEFTRDGDAYVVDGHVLDDGNVQLRLRARAGFAVVEGPDWVVALDTALTPELEREGRARDLVRQIQQLRKDNDLLITDRIAVLVPDTFADVLEHHAAWISSETLARSITVGPRVEIAPTDD